jgi:hypothetical protein
MDDSIRGGAGKRPRGASDAIGVPSAILTRRKRAKHDLDVQSLEYKMDRLGDKSFLVNVDWPHA